MADILEEQPNYALESKGSKKLLPAPDLPYRPRTPKSYHPKIGVIGCGGISEHHLRAYKKAGFNIAALCDCLEAKATQRQQEFFPQAAVSSDYRHVLERRDIEVVDVTPHPDQRVEIIEAALRAGKHVLSQKPFAVDLDVGERLVAMAANHGVLLAVNQNARWAPHYSYIRHAIKRGLIGNIISAHLSVHWNHNWVVGTPFDNIHHLVLYDFAIHWFDLVAHWFDRPARRVFASTACSPSQKATPPLLGQALIEFDHGQSTLAFDADTRCGAQDRTFITGTKGTISSVGTGTSDQAVTLFTDEGQCQPRLEGEWFPDAFHGTMGELLCAIEEQREPAHNARDNLKSLALCFAAVASANDGLPREPGTIRQLPRM